MMTLPNLERLLYACIAPRGAVRRLYRGLFSAHVATREALEWARRTWLATPAFLSLCERHGERITFDQVPYLTGSCRIQIGNDVRGSGQMTIHAARAADPLRKPLLRMGDGVFIGNGVAFRIAQTIEIGNYVAIGAGTFITDTEGHDKYGAELKPAWQTPAGPDDIAPVVIEDGVWIGPRCAVFKGVRIGARSIIGFGAVVRSDVPPGSVVLGNPARIIPKKAFRAETPTGPSSDAPPQAAASVAVAATVAVAASSAR